jgi:ubiquinone/menaquinone biosynthesis C-methylase UbiE
MSYNSLIPLMKNKGCSFSPEKFQERVNVIFHNHEAAFYDEMHDDMKYSLQEQVNLLVSDVMKKILFSEKKLRVLDIGCGTGLSSEFLLNSKLGPFIEHVTLLDTSEKMLEYAEKKAVNWNKDFTLVNSTLSSINEKYDVVMICSVLHHIPNLEEFLTEVKLVLNKNGVLFHLQDPNGDYLENEFYLERLKTFEKDQELVRSQKRLTDFVPKEFKSLIKRWLGRKNYIDFINDQLLKEGVIKRRMSADELWSVTDIHVTSNSDTSPKGISLKFLNEHLNNFILVNQRSYGFFGKLKFDLDLNYASMEEKFIAENRLDGRNISGVWIKNK